MGWRAAVAGAALVLTVALTAGGLYRSSVATAALQREVRDICPADTGLSITAAPAPGPRVDFARTSLNALAASVPGTDAPVIVEQTSSAAATIEGRRDTHDVVVAHRDGQEKLLTPSSPALAGNDALVPAWWAAAVHVAVGDQLSFGAQGPVLRVAGEYDTFDADTPTSPWCGQRALFAAGPFGDPATPVVFAAAPIIDDLDGAGVAVTSTWQLHVRPTALHEDDVQATIDGLDAFPSRSALFDSDTTVRFFLRVHPGTLANLQRRSGTVAEVVARTTTPVEVAAITACGAMLVAAGALLARQRRSELQLLVERGAPPRVVARRVGRRVLPPAIVGAASGFAVAALGVAAVGPSPALGYRAIVVAAGLATAGGLVAIVVVAVTATVATHTSVDPAPRRRLRRFVPWEVIPLALAWISWRQVSTDGGVHLSGVDIVGGPALAEAFPVLLTAAVVAVLARPFFGVLGRHRMAGRRLPLGPRLGVRRLAGDAPATVIVVLAGALATATFSVAVLLRDSANDAATRKADTFVGADLALDTAGDHALPSSLADRTTRVARLDARAGDTPVDVLAIDPTTFARAASGLDARTAGAVDALGAGHLDAVVAGGALPTTDLDIDGSAIAVDVVETVDVFPGLRSGAPLVVVDARSLPSTVTKKADEIWLHDPPVDAVAQLQAAGFPVYGVRTPQRVFDAVSFLAVDWSFAGMQAFGLAIGALVVLVQLLVVAARRRQREVAWIVSRRMAVRTATHRRAIAVELGVPTGLAVAGGLALACTAARLAAGALDPRPELPPSAGFVVNPSVFAAVAIAGVIVLLVLGAVATAALTRVDAIEVVRGEG